MTEDGVLDHVTPEDASYVQLLGVELDVEPDEVVHRMVLFFRAYMGGSNLREEDHVGLAEFCEHWHKQLLSDFKVQVAMRRLDAERAEAETGDGSDGAVGGEDGLGECGDSP